MNKIFAAMTLFFLVMFPLLTNFGYAETTAIGPLNSVKIIEGTEQFKHLRANAGNILWDTSHGVYLNYRPSGNYSDLTTVLSQKGYFVDDNDTGILNLNLDNYDIVVICLSSAWDSMYSIDEVAALANFVDKGGGLLIMGDANAPNQNINPVAQAFGTTLGLSTISPINLYISRMTDHVIFTNVTEIFMRLAGEISGAFPDSEVAWTDNNEAVVTVFGVSGHVVSLGDFNIFTNSYLTNVSNQVFAENVFDWLSPRPLAWDVCFAADIDSAEYQFNVEADNIIRGRAIGPSPEFPAPLTGYYNSKSNLYSFTIGFRNHNSRYYLIFVSNLMGVTWEIRGTDSSYYDIPHMTRLEYCSSISTQ
jgi:hypothetical protein